MRKLLHILLFVIMCSNTVSAATWYVRSGATGNGTTAATAFGTIADAVTAASNGDVIDIGPGTFAERISLTKSLELRGSNAGSTPWNWSQPATTIVPPSTNFESVAAGALVYIQANGVKINGIEFNGANNSLSDAPARVINGVSARSGWAIVTAGGQTELSFLNNRIRNFTSRGIAASSTTITNAAVEVKNNSFDNLTGTNNVLSIAVLTTNLLPEVTGNRVSNSNFGVLLQYSGSTNIAGVTTVTSNQIDAHVVGIAVRGFSNGIAPAHLIQNNTIARIDYDQWSADGLTKPTGVEFTGMDFSNLLGDNNIRVEGNTIREARSAVYVLNVPKSATNPDRFLVKNNTHLNSRFGVYMDNATVAASRVVVEGTLVRDAKVAGMQVMGEGAFENELVLRNGVVIEHPAPLTDEYNNALYLTGTKAVLAELNDTKLSSAKTNFIVFDNNAMAGKEVDGNNVTYDGTVNDFTFNNYQPSATANAPLRTAVKDRIVDGEDAGTAGSGIVRIGAITGIAALEKYAALQVYPNPSKTGFIQINLTGGQGRRMDVALLNLKGQEVQHVTTTVEQGAAKLQLATGALAKGIYLLKITDGAATSTRKVVVE